MSNLSIEIAYVVTAFVFFIFAIYHMVKRYRSEMLLDMISENALEIAIAYISELLINANCKEINVFDGERCIKFVRSDESEDEDDHGKGHESRETTEIRKESETI